MTMSGYECENNNETETHPHVFFFICFHPSNFNSSITLPQNAAHDTLAWMTVNLLTLSSSNSEFLLTELRQQLAKIHSSPLDIIHSVHILSFISDRHPLSSIKYLRYRILLVSYSWTSLQCISLDYETSNTIATCSVQSKIDYCNSICYRLPNYQKTASGRFSTCLFVPQFPHAVHIVNIFYTGYK